MQNSKSSANGHAAATSILSRDGAEVLDDISAFIRRYLVCDDDQLTILTTPCGAHLPGGMLSPSGASSGRISLIGAGPGGPEEPEEQFRVNVIECAKHRFGRDIRIAEQYANRPYWFVTLY